MYEVKYATLSRIKGNRIRMMDVPAFVSLKIRKKLFIDLTPPHNPPKKN